MLVIFLYDGVPEVESDKEVTDGGDNLVRCMAWNKSTLGHSLMLFNSSHYSFQELDGSMVCSSNVGHHPRFTTLCCSHLI